MEELSELAARLAREHDALQARVRAREAEEQRRLDDAAARLERATSRQARAAEALAQANAETTALTERRAHADQRHHAWAGRLWMMRQVTVLACCMTVGVGSWPLLSIWSAPGTVALQLVALLLGLIVIPRRK